MSHWYSSALCLKKDRLQFPTCLCIGMHHAVKRRWKTVVLVSLAVRWGEQSFQNDPCVLVSSFLYCPKLSLQHTLHWADRLQAFSQTDWPCKGKERCWPCYYMTCRLTRFCADSSGDEWWLCGQIDIKCTEHSDVYQRTKPGLSMSSTLRTKQQLCTQNI